VRMGSLVGSPSRRATAAFGRPEILFDPRAYWAFQASRIASIDRDRPPGLALSAT
jgi:hypothetical protein